MKRTAIPLLLLLSFCAFALPLSAQETGRTDGPEGSEYEKGGYPFGGPAGRFYLSGAFGSGFFEAPGGGSDETGFLYAFGLGYERDGWFGLQGDYAYLADRKMSIFSLGSRFTYPYHPFVYHCSVHAGLYDPSAGESHFGLAPGAGIDLVVHDRVRIGLNYKHDFIFSDVRTHLNRVYAGLNIAF